jgi:hypothetical protein
MPWGVAYGTPLRFAERDEVLAYVGQWRAGIILQRYYRQDDFPPGRCAAYQIRLHDATTPIYAPDDTDSYVKLATSQYDDWARALVPRPSPGVSISAPQYASMATVMPAELERAWSVAGESGGSHLWPLSCFAALLKTIFAAAQESAPAMDTVAQVQLLFENAWASGFAMAGHDFGGRLVGKCGRAGWTGPSDFVEVLAHLGVDAATMEVIVRPDGHDSEEALDEMLATVLAHTSEGSMPVILQPGQGAAPAYIVGHAIVNGRYQLLTSKPCKRGSVQPLKWMDPRELTAPLASGNAVTAYQLVLVDPYLFRTADCATRLRTSLLRGHSLSMGLWEAGEWRACLSGANANPVLKSQSQHAIARVKAQRTEPQEALPHGWRKVRSSHKGVACCFYRHDAQQKSQWERPQNQKAESEEQAALDDALRHTQGVGLSNGSRTKQEAAEKAAPKELRVGDGATSAARGVDPALMLSCIARTDRSHAHQLRVSYARRAQSTTSSRAPSSTALRAASAGGMHRRSATCLCSMARATRCCSRQPT